MICSTRHCSYEAQPEESSRICSMDESGFSDDPGRCAVIVKRSTKCATSSHSGTGKSHSTVRMCSSAAGE
ncbi:unnamed protein product [Didymodactylos carnosus]|uniref:Uncharacterized protein n=1 Tax=Didymodactylos carnosus TaxID=1234261 RepID=A0A815FDR1_9BILA|nr:unnamed protein product [Didymodactylos carnosus]CAF4174307.1 unnamed protein product [Didymodactylos carnosus]